MILKETKKRHDYSFKKYINKIIRSKRVKKKKNNLTNNKSLKDNNKIEMNKINKNKQNEINNNQKIIKKRNAGVDLLRIVTMLGIIYTHILDGQAQFKYSQYRDKLFSTLTYTFYHNNAYGLISGIVGYKSTKYSNLLFLWLYVVFYSVGILYYFKNIKHGNVEGELYTEFFPVIFGRYWYFTSYFAMYMFLPAVNKGIQYLNKPEFKALVMSICGIFVIWQSFMNEKDDQFKMGGGFSTIWLLCLYITGAYIGKYNVVYTGIKRYIFSFIYLFIFLFSCFIHIKYSNYTIIEYSRNYKVKFNNCIKKLSSNSLICVIKFSQAISLALLLLQLKYNKYLSKLITFVGPLVFAAFLIHANPNFRINYYHKFFEGESQNLTFNEVIRMLILTSIKIFLGCIIIDYLRHLLFTILRIRKICIFIERIFFKIIS